MKFAIPLFMIVFVLLLQPFGGIGSGASVLNAQNKAKTKTKAADKAKAQDAAGPAYLCPSHPEVTSDKPGKCRVCSMDLEKQDKAPVPLSGPGSPGEIVALNKEVKGYKFELFLTPIPLPPDPEEAKKINEIPTYRVDVSIEHLKTKKNVKDADVWFHIVYPSGRNLMPHLAQLEDRYTAEINLPKTGIYTFMIHANMKSGNVEATFKKVMH